MEKTRYYPGIKRYIASRISNPDDAEDLAQSVFLEFYQGNHNGENPEPYLFGIARNLIARYYLDKRKQPNTIPTSAIEKHYSTCKERDDTEQSGMRKCRDILTMSLEQLPHNDYETIRLCLSGELSLKETAQRAKIPVTVFYKRYQRALKILRKISLKILEEDSGGL
jgi:RNA polymerase sigma-70 factor (ECF subfamily)